MVKLGSVAAAVFYLIVVKAFFRESKSFSYCHNSAAVYHKCNGLAPVFGGSLDKSTAAAGANELNQGILTMKNGAPALVDGVTKLRDGAMQLSDGLKEFDEKGVSKLTELVEGDLEGMLERVKAIADVSRNYRSFAGISDDMDGQVKFIYRTDAIGD